MPFGISVGELAVLAGAILLAGTLSGLLSGLFGIGGSTIVIPVLYELFRFASVPDDIRMQLCIGTALAVTVPTTLRAYFEHRAKSAVLPGVLRLWALPAGIGVAAATLIAYVAPANFFKAMFILFALFMAVRLLFGRDSWVLGRKLPGRAMMAAIGIATGCLSMLVGVAGGAFSTLFLTLYGQPFHRAVATSTGIGSFIAVLATVGYMVAGWPQQALMPPFSIGFVSLIGAAVLVPAAVIAAPYGARLAHRMPKRKLEAAFGLYLILIAARFAASLLS
jgi:uncharacterized membrane protein YfcA